LGCPRPERPSEQELRRGRLSGSAGPHVQQFRRERGERRFQRAVWGALKSNRAPPGGVPETSKPQPCRASSRGAAHLGHGPCCEPLFGRVPPGRRRVRSDAQLFWFRTRDDLLEEWGYAVGRWHL